MDMVISVHSDVAITKTSLDCFIVGNCSHFKPAFSVEADVHFRMSSSKRLSQGKKQFFHKKHVPHKFTGPIHALLMQMLASGIIHLVVTDSTKVGSEDLKDEHIELELGLSKDVFGRYSRHTCLHLHRTT